MISLFFHLDYSFLWVQQGNAEIFIDSQSFSINSNVLVFLRPGQQFRCTSGTIENGFILSFAADFLDLHETKATSYIQESLFNHLLVTPIIKLKDDLTRFMLHAATKMHEEFTNASPYRQEILKGFLKIFIIYTSRAADILQYSSTVPKKLHWYNSSICLLRNILFLKN